MDNSSKLLLAIIELGGYPNFSELYQQAGYQVEMVNSVRKANSWLKRNKPDVVVAEFNFQTDFRDRTSNVESLMASLQKHPDVHVIVFYDQGVEVPLQKLLNRYPKIHTLTFPIAEDKLKAAIALVNA